MGGTTCPRAQSCSLLGQSLGIVGGGLLPTPTNIHFPLYQRLSGRSLVTHSRYPKPQILTRARLCRFCFQALAPRVPTWPVSRQCADSWTPSYLVLLTRALALILCLRLCHREK